MMTLPRIVAVSYLNTIPFVYGIEHAEEGLHAGLTLVPPSDCARAMARGEAELGLVPVAAIPSLADVSIVTPYCLGAHGPVRTVVLAANRPLQELTTLYLDPHSLTSVRLARVLAQRRWGIAPRWEPLTPERLAAPAPDEGFILIGDKVFAHEEQFALRYDLAAEWQALTGLPFVFAAWVARRGVDPAQTAALTRALAYGTAHIPEAIARYGYADRPYAYEYLTQQIDFSFDAPKRQALQLYWKWCSELQGEPPSW